jgi:lipoate-protein ligase A
MIFTRASWRLIHSPAADGAWNMAVDDAMLEATTVGAVPPTLRLYDWRPPCLSLGHAQPLSDVNLEALQVRGWSLVRRPTGGRAILHIDELTYSVTGPQSEARLTGSILDSYRVLAQALLQALHLMGIQAQALEKPVVPAVHAGGAPVNPVCFETPSNYEITVAGKKLIGSAQARRKGGVLQHGSLPLYGDLTRIVQGLSFPDQEAELLAAERLLERATTVEQILGSPLTWEAAAQAFAQAFQSELNLELTSANLTKEELARANELVGDKYANPTWTGKT